MNTLFIDVILASCNLYILSLKKKYYEKKIYVTWGGYKHKEDFMLSYPIQIIILEY